MEHISSGLNRIVCIQSNRSVQRLIAAQSINLGGDGTMASSTELVSKTGDSTEMEAMKGDKWTR